MSLRAACFRLLLKVKCGLNGCGCCLFTVYLKIVSTSASWTFMAHIRGRIAIYNGDKTKYAMNRYVLLKASIHSTACWWICVVLHCHAIQMAKRIQLTLSMGNEQCFDDQHDNEKTRMTYEQQRLQHCRDPDQHWFVTDCRDPCSSRRNFGNEDHNRETIPSLLCTEQNVHRAGPLDSRAHDDLHVSF